MARKWFYEKDGTQLGPVSSNELRQLAENGDLEPTNLVWREGTSEWRPANSVKGLVFPTSSTASPETDVGDDSEVDDSSSTVRGAGTDSEPLPDGWFDERELGTPAQESTYSPAIRAEVKSSGVRTRRQPSLKRYPNLIRYITMVEGMIRVAFWIGVALEVVVLVIFVLYVLFMKKELDDDFVKTLLRIVTAVIVTAMGIGVSWLWMVFMLASTEFVQVIIDIESNTRTSAETLLSDR